MGQAAQVDWAHDPVASYVKEFDLAEPLLGKPVCISFQGAEQAIYVWLNGQFIGYREDSFTPLGFDITDAVCTSHYPNQSLQNQSELELSWEKGFVGTARLWVGTSHCPADGQLPLGRPFRGDLPRPIQGGTV
ncbi:MAG: hypothetical protein LUG65_05605, partial [Clostridiales bacterium]|nr:hypothetical protein [Clostridiales bacterium]